MGIGLLWQPAMVNIVILIVTVFPSPKQISFLLYHVSRGVSTGYIGTYAPPNKTK